MRPTRLILPAACAALLLSAGTAAAQAHGEHHPPQHGAHHPAQPADSARDGWTGDLPAHFEGITLTAAQKARVVALQKEYHARMDALRDSAKAAGASVTDNAPLQARIQAVMTEEHAAFRALLDEAGRKRFDENMARMHAGKGHGAAPRPPRD